MFNPLNFISKFIKSSNQKELDRIDKIVKKINLLENKFKEIDDLNFPKKNIRIQRTNQTRKIIRCNIA